MLPDKKFARVHKSFIVAIDKIDHIEKNRIRIADQIIPIRNTYADIFLKC
ncbi:LytTR family transcriptional regulator DNA-binding domain-containing protein [Cesiribacter sp. SM1]|nr:LytTR family transcriptional regulator DNA-binding domain-containing protein [Cesiribacter sp. SM1]